MSASARAVARRAALGAAAFLLAAACGPDAPPRPGAAGRPLVVRRGALEDRFTLTGELAAARSEILRVPRTNWLIGIKWLIEDGAVVKKGDRVVELDTSTLSGSLADKRLAVQRAASDLVSDTAKNASTLADKRMEVERKRVALDKARVEAAVPPDLRTRREHQEKQLAVTKEADALAKAEEDLAAQRRAALLDRRVKEIALERARRELAEIEGRLEDLALRAPRDGLVQISMNAREGVRKYQIGDSTFPGADVVTMPDLSVMEVRARLFDVDEGAIRVGMRAECFLDAHPGRKLMGVVGSISPVARAEGRDAVRRIFDVVVRLDATDPEIMLPGMSARVEVVRRRAEQAVVVPRAALRAAGGKTLVRLASGREEQVELEFCALEACALRTGLAEGTALAPAAVTVDERRPS